jgi:hypothetical protein
MVVRLNAWPREVPQCRSFVRLDRAGGRPDNPFADLGPDLVGALDVEILAMNPGGSGPFEGLVADFAGAQRSSLAA